jgi:lipoprotein-releasing system permease protein
MAWNLGFESRVALRFLREGRQQTLLIIVGVAAGVAVYAYISALVSGLQANTLTKTLGAQPHITVRALDDSVIPAAPIVSGQTPMTQTQARARDLRSLANWQALMAVLEQDPAVAAVSPQVSGSALALRGEASQAVSLTGIDLDRHDRVVGLRAKVVAGQARLEPGEAIVGRELAQDLGLQVGDRLILQTATASEAVRITAWVDLGLRDVNRRTVLVTLRGAQSLLALPGGVSGHLGGAGAVPGCGGIAGRDGGLASQGHRAQRQQPQAGGAPGAHGVRLDLPDERHGLAAGRSAACDLACGRPGHRGS